ncbi:DNA polymerase IV [Schaalia vaccimaxillae]|uniref:DNA polymerase IV n=1 Tax=Schaalia vaccimaxillae TaxID=183916 RepID=UPI0003B4E597|nr:DNA polymerase IV [Schaalia vaccimaxillae]
MSNAPRDARVRRNWGSDDTGANILHIDMDSFFAQVEMLEDPSLVGHPILVGGTGMRGVVTSATYEARAAGVRAGMPMARARALCPQARVVAGSRGVYSQYSRRVMNVLAGITPQVEKVSIDEAFLDVTGALRRLGSSVEIAKMIRRQVRQEVGLPASVGIASTKSVAKIASSNAKPDGLLLVPAASTTQFLHGLPVGALWGVGGKTQKILDREGVVTIGDLAHLPISRAARLLGSAHAHQLHDLAWGIDPRPVRPAGREKSMGTEKTFSHDVRSRAHIERFILEASHECAQRLRTGDMVAWTVGIKMRDGDFHTITRSVTLSVPTDLGRDIAQAARSLFDKEAMPTSGVRLFGVRVESLQPRSSGVAVTLDQDEKPTEAERAMDRVVRKFGPQAIAPASLLSGTDQRISRLGSESH